MGIGKWDDLRFVLAVAEAGSVNAAADVLQVNHATILRRVASFEQAHSVTIFIRHAKGYTVAPDAVPIIEAIRQIEKSVDAMERVISGQEESLHGLVRITSTDSLCHSVLPPMIHEFQKAHPSLRIELHSTNLHENLAKLDADLTIRPAKVVPPDLTGKIANTMTFMIYGSREYLAQNQSPRLKDHTWLGVTDLLKGSPVGQWQTTLPEQNLAFLADSFVTLAEMAQTGLGLAMMPTYTGNANPSLVQAANFPDALKTNIWVACHHDLQSSARIVTCLDYFAAAIGRSTSFAA